MHRRKVVDRGFSLEVHSKNSSPFCTCTQHWFVTAALFSFMLDTLESS